MNTQGSSHLVIEDRKVIENLLSKDLKCNDIAAVIGKDARTISREIRHHRIARENGRYNAYPTKDNSECKRLSRFPYVCMGCPKRTSCRKKIWYFYNANTAQKEYEALLKSARVGLDISEEAYLKYNEALKGGTEKGQSIHHIAVTNPDVCYSERSIYRHIDEKTVDVPAIDLRRKVKLKPRKHYTYTDDNSAVREGRRYVDFLKVIHSMNPFTIMEMDTVEGAKSGNGACLLTLHSTAMHFMLIYLLESKEKDAVSEKIIQIQEQLGIELFRDLFSITLTDRGPEFCDPLAVEVDHETGEKICSMFYCNSYSSYQKGAIEENHELIRYVLPKGLSFDHLTQEKVNLLASHINSYHRSSIDATPIELFETIYGAEALKKTKIRYITPDLVRLKPSLLTK